LSVWADILHTHLYDEAVIGWLAKRIYPKTRLVVGRHYSDSIYRSTTGVKRKTLLALEQMVNRAAARIVVPSTYIRDILTRWQGINPTKVDLVPYGFVPRNTFHLTRTGCDACVRSLGWRAASFWAILADSTRRRASAS